MTDYDKLNELQEEGIHFLQTKKGCILGDGVGAGKTRQAAVAIEQIGKKALVVTFGYLQYEFAKEVSKWTKLRCQIINGNKTTRSGQYRTDADIWITSYDLLSRDYEELCQLPIGIIVADEAHAMENMTAQRSRLMVELPKTEYRWAMTASLVDKCETEHKLSKNLYNIMTFIGATNIPFYKVPKKKFKRRIMYQARRNFEKNVDNYFLRRTPDMFGIDDPREIEVTLNFDKRAKRLYDDLESGTRRVLEDRPFEVKNSFVHLRQFCNAPQILGHDYTSPKVDYILNFLRKVDGKVLIFSDYRRFINILYNELDGKPALLVGGMSKVEKEVQKESFRKDVDVMLATSTGEYGHNLQVAKYVILSEIPFTPRIYEQRVGRINRPGKSGQAQVYSLMMAGSVEERIKRKLYARKDKADIKMNNEWIRKVLGP